ncbi:MAG: NAD(P)/FAD-dependent oxidoreductase [Candidatus Avoscillospira sp.]
MNELRHKVLVVGGGAAGMLAAGAAAEAGAKVILLEKNDRLGKKLAITGKGRCNVTNHCSPDEVLKNIPRNGRFLYSALNAFPPEQTMAFFEGLGCPLKTERGNRVFPESDQSASVILALRKYLREQHVEVRQARVQAVLTEDGSVTGVQTEAGVVRGSRVILCTGGRSYPLTGSTGDGYQMAEKLGHTIVPTRGSLVPLEEDGDWCAKMQGLSLKNVAVRLQNEKGKTVYEDFGELLFTHFGLSGPTILSASTHRKEGEQYKIVLDLKPALDEQKLDLRMLRDLEQYPNRSIAHVLEGLFPKSMVPVMLERSSIDPSTQANSVTRQQRRTLLELTKRFPIQIRGPRPVEEAIVTAGGVRVKEVDPKTMESKLVHGLYFAGELLDLDAYTGGFNLQIAWSTGRAAGLAAGGD